ncbi:MAG TPA: hypothetical protein ENK06_05550 [Gammaproteobacteria bacterium]|nr:hypothetical protein [Gammaproteobacteria bacterium]
MSEYSNVDAYTKMDFSRKSDNAQALMEDDILTSEADAGDIKLSDIESNVPVGLTPHMVAWYMENVQPYRRNAINEIDGVLKNISEDDQVGAALLERSLDEIEKHETLEKRKTRQLHWEQNAGDFSKLKVLKSERDSAKQTYDRKFRERGSKQPKVIKWWYYLLLFIVGITEILVNYDSFTSVKLLTPATALGTAIGVAILVALSSHFVGMFFAQHRAYFKDASHENDKGHALRMFALGDAFLVTALGVVGYSRYYFFMDIIKQWEVLGGDNAPSMLPIIGGSLGTNMVVWSIGVGLAFMLHDPDPKYPGLKKQKDECEKKYRDLERGLSKGLDADLKRISAKADEDRGHAKSLDESMQSHQQYKAARKLFDKLSKNDAGVTSLLHAYKNSFSKLSRKTNTKIFHQKDDVSLLDNGKQTQDLSPAEYEGLALKMRYL